MGRGLVVPEPVIVEVDQLARSRIGAHAARLVLAALDAGEHEVAFLSLRAGVPTADLLLRALAAGVLAYVVAWTCAVAVWRHLVIAELRAVRRHQAEAAARLAAQRAEAQ